MKSNNVSNGSNGLEINHKLSSFENDSLNSENENYNNGI